MAKKAQKSKVTLESLDRKLDRFVEQTATKVDIAGTNKSVAELNAKVDRVIDAMVTHEDLRQLEERLERKIDERMVGVIESIDKLVKPITELQLEYAAIKTQLTRHEEWLKILAEKTGVKLPI